MEDLKESPSVGPWGSSFFSFFTLGLYFREPQSYLRQTNPSVHVTTGILRCLPPWKVENLGPRTEESEFPGSSPPYKTQVQSCFFLLSSLYLLWFVQFFSSSVLWFFFSLHFKFYFIIFLYFLIISPKFLQKFFQNLGVPYISPNPPRACPPNLLTSSPHTFLSAFLSSTGPLPRPPFVLDPFRPRTLVTRTFP